MVSPGSETLLNVPVTVYCQQSTQNYNLNLSSTGGASVSGSGWPGVPNSNQSIFGFNMPAQILTLVVNLEQQAIPGQPILGVYVEDHPLGVIVTNIMSGYHESGKIQHGDILTHIGFLSHGAVTSLGGGMVRIGLNTINVNFP